MATELTIDTSATAMQMAEAIFGQGIQVLSASISGNIGQSGIYSGGLTTSPGVVPADSGVILSTGLATDFTTSGADPNLLPNTTTDFSNGGAISNGHAGLTALAGAQTYDATILSATFIPDGNVITMQIVFSSEEYLEWVGQGYNDIVAVWVNGVQATLTVGTGDISIDNINTNSNSNLYVDNTSTLDPSAAYNTEMDGFTVTMTLKAEVNPGQTNTIVFGIADTGDGELDSNLLIAGDSVQVALLANDDTLTLHKRDIATVDLRANDIVTPPSALTVTQINGVSVVAGSTVVLPTGESITLNADGTITVETVNTFQNSVFSYTVADTQGNSDVGFVTVNTVPCFTVGTWIDTACGRKRVEELEIGDLVTTADNGNQPVRWIGRTLRRAIGPDAPVEIPEKLFGDHDRLIVSQNHRVLLRSSVATLVTGEAELLVSAKHLAQAGQALLIEDRKLVLYLHILFDNHEIIRSNGLETESLFLTSAQASTQEDGIFTARDLPASAPRHRRMARPALTGREAMLLRRAA